MEFVFRGIVTKVQIHWFYNFLSFSARESIWIFHLFLKIATTNIRENFSKIRQKITLQQSLKKIKETNRILWFFFYIVKNPLKIVELVC